MLKILFGKTNDGVASMLLRYGAIVAVIALFFPWKKVRK